ncbi:hypothetical protein LZ554_008750 [Drepanopeziza brunnea f. sp. 'monogermtubi']|nr:hypothetical protein LZ554_008750 [Drepanopeziza brunnea f. sp. 'monogermtubi']
MAPQEVNASGGDGGVEGTAIVCLRGGKGDGKKEKKEKKKTTKKMKKEAKSHEKDQLPINDDTKPTHGSGGSGQDHPEVLRAAIQRQQVQLDTLLSGPTRDKSKATKLARKIADATKSLEGLEHEREMDYRNYPDQTGDVNKEEAKEEQQVKEPVTKKSKKSKKRKAAEIDEDKEEAGQQVSGVTVAEVNTIQDTSKSKNKKRKKDKSLQDSNIIPSSIVAFADSEALDSGRPTTNGLPSALKAVHNPKTSKHNIDDAPADARTPQQVKMDALLATITSTRSPPASDDRRLDALIAGTVSAKSPAAICMDKLIAVGQAALKAAVYPTRPPSEISESEPEPQPKPAVVLPPRKGTAAHVTDKEPQPIVPAKNGTSDSHARIETPIPLPQRKISTTTRITPGMKRTPAESSKLAGHQKSEEHAQTKNPSSQTATALKQAASATVIIGDLSSQPDPFTSSIRTGPAPKLPRAISSPRRTLSKAPKRSRGKRVDAEGGEDWEVASGRVRARINAEGTTDDQETEENIAFSSTYLSTRPLGISISGTKFQVLAISSGTEQELPMHASKESVKICSVAKSRVQVALGGKTFAIGEGGMWRVRAGEKCVVVNNNELGSGQGVVANVHICTTDA